MTLKIAYLIISAIYQFMFLALAVLSPIYLTPNSYWWTAFGISLFILSDLGITKRVNSWGDLGKVG
jgi:uncharacterized membrane protein YccC